MENFAFFTMTSLIFFYRAYFLRYSYLSEVKKLLQGTWSPPPSVPPTGASFDQEVWYERFRTPQGIILTMVPLPDCPGFVYSGLLKAPPL